jgi:hypothetical protein
MRADDLSGNYGVFVSPEVEAAVLRRKLDDAKAQIADLNAWCTTKEMIAKCAAARADDAEARLEQIQTAGEIGTLWSFYEIVRCHMMAEGGIPMSDALGVAMDALDEIRGRAQTKVVQG